MAEKACSEARRASLYQEADRVRVRRELEDAPMTRISPPSAGDRVGSCPVGGRMTALLEEQTRLLYDLLGAVTSLTAAQLARTDRRDP